MRSGFRIRENGRGGVAGCQSKIENVEAILEKFTLHQKISAFFSDFFFKPATNTIEFISSSFLPCASLPIL